MQEIPVFNDNSANPDQKAKQATSYCLLVNSTIIDALKNKQTNKHKLQKMDKT